MTFKNLLFGCLGLFILAGAHLFPRETLSSGILFTQNDLDRSLVGYSEEEKAAILKDYALIEAICFGGKKPRDKVPQYLATAGAPGARKSTILEGVLRSDPSFSQAVYLDPDQRALKWMVNTYYSRSLTAFACTQVENYQELQKAAYDKWRSASHFIANSIFEKALKGRYDIAHGTTMTGLFVQRLMRLIKAQGYAITLALCSCEDEVRQKAIHYRNTVQGFYQTDPHDVVEKGRIFPTRMPLYFTFADQLFLFWSDRFDEKERLAATFSQEGIKISDQEAYDKFIAKYERDRLPLKEEEKLELPTWEALVASWMQRTKKSKDPFHNRDR